MCCFDNCCFKVHLFAVFFVFIGCKCSSVIMREYTVGYYKTILRRSFVLVGQYPGLVYVHCLLF